MGENKEQKGNGSKIRIVLICFLPVCILLSCFSVIFLSAMGLMNVVYDGSTENVEGLLNNINIDDSIIGIDEADLPKETVADTSFDNSFPPETNIPEETLPLLPPDNMPDDTITTQNDRILKITETATADYFNDALFLGDSRMVGLALSSQDIGATFYASVGLALNQLETKKISKDLTALELMENDEKQYKKIYMMFGLNELGWAYANKFAENYKEAILKVRSIYPDADICVMSIMPVSEKANIKSFTPETANLRIAEYNSLLLELVQEIDAWYLPSYELFADERGFLPTHLSSDGIHLRADSNKKLMNYISNHMLLGVNNQYVNTSEEKDKEIINKDSVT